MDKIKAFFKANGKPVIIPTVVLFVISAVIALALAAANEITAPTIAKLEEQAQNEAMEKVIKADEYKLCKTEQDGEEIQYYTAEEKGEIKGYIFTFAEKGYGGDVKVMTAVDTEGKVIAVDILDASNETPGLGQNVTKEKFYSSFKGRTEGVEIVKNGANPEKNQVDAVTGATISSKAVGRAVDRATGLFGKIAAEKTGGEVG